MKKLLLFAAIAVIAFSSCSHSIYPVEGMYSSYHAKMRNTDDLEIKSKVKIFFTEKEVNSEYTIISTNAYKPFCLLPFKSLQEKKLINNFLRAAVKQAYEEGGNAILIRSAIGSTGTFYVLNLTNWNADDEAAASYVNPIFNMDKANQIKNGLSTELKRSERVLIEKAFIDEIESNIDNIYELAEIEVIREKIKILSDYNLTLKNPKKSIEKTIKKGIKICNIKEKIIIKKQKKAQKQSQK